MAEDYYSVLGVPRDATTQDIKRAFRQIARECHPDVAGEDASAEQRFKTARKAYETLMDPVTRGRYDRRGQRRMHAGGSFFDAFYRASGEAQEKKKATGPSYAAHASGGAPSGARTGRHNPGNDVGLDDLLSDFGFGGLKGARSPRTRPAPDAPPRGTAMPGEDVHIDIEVPARTAEKGGSITAVYYRMQRSDSWRPGAPDHGLVRIQDIADIRIIPGTRDGSVLRERGLGDAGVHGGGYGDLIATVTVPGPGASSSAERPERTAPKPQPRPSPPPPAEPTVEVMPVEDETITVDVSVVEALLGGRVELETPQGKVRLTIAPGTSGGTRLRLKGKGTGGSDLYVLTRVVVPRDLDEESRGLIEAFARLNP